MASVNPEARVVPLQNLPLGAVVSTTILLICSLSAVGVRIHVRCGDRVFGLDDGLMLGGAIVYLATVALGIYCFMVGIGSHDALMNEWMMMESMKYYTIWILLYVVSLALVKSSICITIGRIASTMQSLQVGVWVLLAITWASFVVTFVGTLLFCKPVEANWRPELVANGKGSCANRQVLAALGQVATATTILTDLGLVILPGTLIWKMQMEHSAKLQVFALLSFASVASITTIIRVPYVLKQTNETADLQFWLGYILLLSNIELGVGCIASSAPTLRRLFQRIRQGSSHPVAQGDPDTIITIGGSGAAKKTRRNIFSNPTDTGFSLATVHAPPDGQWKRLQDGDSDNAKSGVGVGAGLNMSTM